MYVNVGNVCTVTRLRSTELECQNPDVSPVRAKLLSGLSFLICQMEAATARLHSADGRIRIKVLGRAPELYKSSVTLAAVAMVINKKI